MSGTVVPNTDIYFMFHGRLHDKYWIYTCCFGESFIFTDKSLAKGQILDLSKAVSNVSIQAGELERISEMLYSSGHINSARI